MSKLRANRIFFVCILLAIGLMLAACGGGNAEPAGDEVAVGSEESGTESAEAEAEPQEEEEEEAISVSIEESAEESADMSDMAYQEAPMLAAMVDAGDLPPVSERVPSNPRVVPVYDEIGDYGGTWRRAYSGITDRWGPTKLLEERIIEFYANPDGSIEVLPNWADEFTISEDARNFTFHIREGMKWSDGVPVTTEDVRFWYEDIFSTDLFRSSPPQNLTTNGNPLTIEIVDDYTFIVQFSDPYPLFPFTLAKESTGAPGLTRDSFLEPAHYLKDYHPNYVAEEELNAIADEKGVDGWVNLWGDKGPIHSWWLNPDLPVISAWKIETPAPSERAVMVRNPYYHAVDAEGNQLPYIDYVSHDLFESRETANLWVVEGLIDMQGRHVGNISNFTLFKENEDSGNYEIILWQRASTSAIFPNLNVEDPVLNELFNDPRFRQAISHSLNREEINEVDFNGLGEPRQASPASGSPQYDAEFESKWVEYDVEAANALLDEIGLAELDDDGFRLRSDGETLEIIITTRSSDPSLELLPAYLADIGIKASVNSLERSLYEELTSAGDYEFAFSSVGNPILPTDPRQYIGIDALWAPLYGEWFDTNGASGIEPPEGHPILDVWAAWTSAQTAATLDEALEHVQEMVSIHRENIWMIGTVGESPSIYVKSKDMINVPGGLVGDDALRDIGIGQPAQFAFRSE